MTDRQYARARNGTENSLLKMLEENGYKEKFYYDHIKEYMLYYDALFNLNEKMKNSDVSNSQYFDCLKEKRQVTKEMRNILSFLKLEPTETGGLGDSPEDL